MIERLKGAVLRILRVPPEPAPPTGDPGSVRVFRASPAYFRYKLIGWGLGQVGTLIGLVAGLMLLGLITDRFGGWVGLALIVAEAFAWVAFLVQVPFTFAALRLDYELRWYMLSDRALRIREGILKTRELTMTFANVQQISIRQGPVQRLLGIADVEVRTAGGGGSSSDEQAGADMHRGFFRGIQDAETIRDTVRARVQEYRGAGPAQGAPVPATATAAPPADAPTAPGPGSLAAARELLAEVQALRQVLAG
jgi:membrane protein YdbS with pleckstrin-like domain